MEKQRLEHFFSRLNRRKLLSSLLPLSTAGAASAAGILIGAPAALAAPAVPASLWWRSSLYTLSEAYEDIGEVYGAIANKLPGLGYTSVQHAGDVHGFKGRYLLAVSYLYISDRNFWQVVACGGYGDQAEAEAYMNEVINMINYDYVL